MKSIGEMLNEMGFNADAPLDTQKAFFKHLVQDADAKQVKRQENLKTKEKDKPAQLEFNLDDDQEGFLDL